MNRNRLVSISLIALLVLSGCVFTARMILSISTEGQGTVVTTLEDQGKGYKKNTTVQLQAIPNEGWTFVSWGQDLTGNNPNMSLKMDSSKSVTAIFEKKVYPLEIAVLGEGIVKEEIVVEKETDYEHGATVKLTAIPSDGWNFSHWEGDLDGSTNPVIITLDSAKSVTAVFEETKYTVVVNKTGEGTVTISPEQDYYDWGSSITVEANPAKGWYLDLGSWSDALDVTDSARELIVNQNLNIYVKFYSISTDGFDTLFTKNIYDGPENLLALQITNLSPFTVTVDKVAIYNQNNELVIEADLDDIIFSTSLSPGEQIQLNYTGLSSYYEAEDWKLHWYITLDGEEYIVESYFILDPDVV